MSEITLGGERLGSGKKQKIELKNYERSSHDLSYIWRSTMAAGTLVPYMSELALPGDSFDINLDCDIKTHPTVGPLFGSYKVQLDVFSCPIRLYNGKLHMNLLNIGLKMQEIKIPQIIMKADGTKTGDNDQINPSSIFSYLNIRGLGRGEEEVTRTFNAIPYLAYWDIYKNYYANKQEEIGAYIHNRKNIENNSITSFQLFNPIEHTSTELEGHPNMTFILSSEGTAIIEFDNNIEPKREAISVTTTILPDGLPITTQLSTIFSTIVWNEYSQTLECSNPGTGFWGELEYNSFDYDGSTYVGSDDRPQIATFHLDQIDNMRKAILQDTADAAPFYIDETSPAPYGPPLQSGDLGYCKLSTQEGLGLKTYQSDLFNNWISTEWIDGENGVNAITAVDTTDGNFTIDSLLLSRKVYDMLNRIAMSGGTYDDWLDAVYTHQRTRSTENPMYMGGLIKELAFQEVVSNAAAQTDITNQPLGTLAGRGTLTKKHKGGSINIKVDEPSYIIGIISLTPRIDYSQGNKWDVNLKTLDDLHKPALDEIGFQDLVTDQMAWWDTMVHPDETLGLNSAGKQPAWINYMTNVNQVRGNFAVKEGSDSQAGGQMYMTLNRRYSQNGDGGIKDLTTYIDPSLYSHIFADTRLDAQNFWAQIGINIYARRKMSARVMPNL
jgi:hypothetical protein